MQTILIVVVLLLNVCVVGVGIYLSSYLKKKAQNLATREEFTELEKQTAALTRATAQIESEIKGDLWNRQKRWELKREVLFDVTRRVSALFDTLKNLENVLQTELRDPSIDNEHWKQLKIDENNKWFRAKAAFDESRLFVGVTCGKDVVDIVDKFSQVITTIANKIHKKDGEIFKKSVSEIFDLNDALRDAVRKELGMDIVDRNKGT